MFAAIVGALQKQHRIVRSAERAAIAACGSIALALFTLIYLLVISDFSVSHVASSSNRDLPVYYKVAALWGAHNGSMLLWVFVTSIFSGIVIYQNRFRYRDMMPYVVAVLMVNLSFFLFLNLFLSNPFEQLVQVHGDGTMQKFIPRDGRGLNPALQYWAMIIHPPILYLGFIGFRCAIRVCHRGPGHQATGRYLDSHHPPVDAGSLDVPGYGADPRGKMGL